MMISNLKIIDPLSLQKYLSDLGLSTEIGEVSISNWAMILNIKRRVDFSNVGIFFIG